MDQETNVVFFPGAHVTEAPQPQPELPADVPITIPLDIEGARFALKQLQAALPLALAILDRAPHYGNEKALRAVWQLCRGANYRTETEAPLPKPN